MQSLVAICSLLCHHHCSTAAALPGALQQVFMALPFVYELRQLLDWACTPTTLMLMDWCA